MENKSQTTVFNFLGYHTQKIQYQRIGEEQPLQIKLSVSHKNYNKKEKIYSLTLKLEIDFEVSKNNTIELLGGFQINDEKILEDENNLISIFSATLFPFVRTTVNNISFDDRPPVRLPILDLRYLNLEKSIIAKKNV